MYWAIFTHQKHPGGASIHEIKKSFPLKPYLALFLQFEHTGGPPLTQFLLLMQFPITWSSIFITGYSSTSASFTIDTTLGRSTSFGIYVEDEEDHLIKSVTFTDSKGFLYGPYTSMSSLYDIINLKTINFPIGEEPPFDDVSF